MPQSLMAGRTTEKRLIWRDRIGERDLGRYPQSAKSERWRGDAGHYIIRQ